LEYAVETARVAEIEINVNKPLIIAFVRRSSVLRLTTSERYRICLKRYGSEAASGAIGSMRADEFSMRRLEALARKPRRETAHDI
jgi:hypothetical protein